MSSALIANKTPLYPLRFEPIFQYRLWGGRRLSHLLPGPLPDGPVGEAWVLSDRADHPSRIADGALKGCSLADVMERSQQQLMGKLAGRFKRFPLLLKFLDAREMLSVQVHPSDKHPELIPAGESGKTEAWVVIEAEQGSRIDASLAPGTTEADLRLALAAGTIADLLAKIDPKPGDAVYIPAGTVHTLGSDVVVFEIQQNSDVTFRLYDWDHVDAKTNLPRPLQVEQALASIDFGPGKGGLATPILETSAPAARERLFDCAYFRLWRLRGRLPFHVGDDATPRVLVCIEGSGLVEHCNLQYAVSKGEVWLLPAELGVCSFLPGEEVTLLEIAIPE